MKPTVIGGGLGSLCIDLHSGPQLPVMTGGFGASGTRLFQPIIYWHGTTVQPWQLSPQCKAGRKQTG